MTRKYVDHAHKKQIRWEKDLYSQGVNHRNASSKYQKAALKKVNHIRNSKSINSKIVPESIQSKRVSPGLILLTLIFSIIAIGFLWVAIDNQNLFTKSHTYFQGEVKGCSITLESGDVLTYKSTDNGEISYQKIKIISIETKPDSIIISYEIYLASSTDNFPANPNEASTLTLQNTVNDIMPSEFTTGSSEQKMERYFCILKESDINNYKQDIETIVSETTASYGVDYSVYTSSKEYSINIFQETDEMLDMTTRYSSDGILELRASQGIRGNYELKLLNIS